MKDCHFIVEFTTHCLANGTGPNGEKDVFQRDNTNRLIFAQSWFYSAFTHAIELARIRGVKAADIHMNLAIKADTAMYNRRYGEKKFRMHEAIMPGIRVTFEAVVADHVTESSLKTILDKMGTYIGLSPYGHRLGYGKFNLITVEVAPSDDSEDSDSKESDA